MRAQVPDPHPPLGLHASRAWRKVPHCGDGAGPGERKPVPFPRRAADCESHPHQGGWAEPTPRIAARGAGERLLDPRQAKAGDREWTCSRLAQNQTGVLLSSHGSCPGDHSTRGEILRASEAAVPTQGHTAPQSHLSGSPGPGPTATHSRPCHALLTWASRISSLCPPSRAWVRCARTRGCPSLSQVTVGSGSESVSQLRMALSLARTAIASWGPLGGRLKVGGTGTAGEWSKARRRERLAEAHGVTWSWWSAPTPPAQGWHRPRELEAESSLGQCAKDLLGDLGKASSYVLWASAP